MFKENLFIRFATTMTSVETQHLLKDMKLCVEREKDLLFSGIVANYHVVHTDGQGTSFQELPDGKFKFMESFLCIIPFEQLHFLCRKIVGTAR